MNAHFKIIRKSILRLKAVSLQVAFFYAKRNKTSVRNVADAEVREVFLFDICPTAQAREFRRESGSVGQS